MHTIQLIELLVIELIQIVSTILLGKDSYLLVYVSPHGFENCHFVVIQ